MAYRITIARGAAKTFRGLHPQVAARLKDAIQALAEDPRPPGCLQLNGGDGELRIRVGDYRIVYDVQDDVLVVLVLKIGHRREIYR
ncbi:type II toxin-antitoxin system RelE family toxin [Glutamicibacter arilaitensis]|uniref:type II toxin-antitoxin system RelE family toxin n=1 Tax=Glutamicibacter arilaitensis TaxID=256701 RepID=UPI003A93E9DA